MTLFLFRFPWSGGAYGVTGPNKKIPHLHLFLTVKSGAKKSDVLHDLKVKFECDAMEFFELLPEPNRKPKVKHLVDTVPSPGGGVLACVETTAPNPMPVSEKNERDDIPKMSGANKGTLTMFGFKDRKHYALTCFHVGFKKHGDKFISPSAETDEQKCSNKVSAMSKKYWYSTRVESNEGIVFDDDGSNYKYLGIYHGHIYCNDCDIMSLEVSEKTEVDCKIVDATFPDWNRIRRELMKNVERVKTSGESAIRVEKEGFLSGLTYGQIVCSSYCQRDLFTNAIIVKGCNGPFAVEGDSGAPVFFIDKRNMRQVFAYVACSIGELTLPDDSDIDDSDSDGSSTSREEDSSCGSQDDTLGYEREEDEYADQDKSGDESEYGGKFEVDKDGKYQHETDDQSNVEIEFSEENVTGPYVVCFHLDTALERLGLIEAACFGNCRKFDP